MIQRIRHKLYTLLRASERYTKTDMVYISKGGFWLIVGHGINIIGGVITTVALANLLPKESYGLYQFVMSGAVIIGIFTLTGMETAITRAVARGADGALRYGFRVKLVWSTGIIIAAGATAAYYYLNNNVALAEAFLIVGVCVPFFESFKLYTSYLIGKEKFRESTMFGIWTKFVPVAAIVIALYITHDPVMIIGAYFLSNTLATGILYWLIVRHYNLPLARDPELTAYSKHLSAMRIITNIAGNIDKILIFHFLGVIPVAIYSIAQIPVVHFQSVLQLVRTLSMPKLSATPFATLQYTLPYKVRILFLATVLLVIGYIFLAPFLFTLLFPAYPESIRLSQVLALTILAMPRTMYTQAFVAHQMKRELYILNITSGLANIGLLIFLLSPYGIWGVVYALLISQLLVTILTHVLFRRTATS